jgi:6,7-dimethyl-8-ribityllumazine synthase
MSQNVSKASFKKFNASDRRVGIVAALFNQDIVEGLLASALEKLSDYGVRGENTRVIRVAGSVEIPVVLAAMAKSGKFDCLVALGAVIRGATPHFDYVAKIASEGCLRVMLDYGVPVGFGVLTCEDREQAAERLHVGGEAVEAALQAAYAIKELRNPLNTSAE